MSFNIFDSAKVLFNNELINKASSFLGETPENTQKAVNGIVPTVVSHIINKTSTSDGLLQVLNLIKNGYHNGGILASVHNFFGDGGSLLSNGANVVNSLFGNKAQTVTNAISSYAGIKNSSAASLLGLAVPSILSLLGKHATSNDGTLSANGLGSVVSDQSSWLSKYIPSGFSSVLGTLGLGSLVSNVGNAATNTNAALKNTTANTYNKTEKVVEESRGGMKWLIPLLLLALIAGAIMYFWKGCGNTKTTAGGTDSTQSVTMPGQDSSSTTISTAIVKGKLDSLSGDFLYDLGKIVTITLPNNVQLNVGEYSTEARLVNFLNDKNVIVDTLKGNWFEFTNVRFKTGGSEISDSSLAQLKNFAAIAKAFPTATFKIGGYTDNTGDSSKNVILSDKRANMVLAKTIELGVAKTAFYGAKGFGPLWPIADNATAEGKAQNRRVAINVKSK